MIGIAESVAIIQFRAVYDGSETAPGRGILVGALGAFGQRQRGIRIDLRREDVALPRRRCGGLNDNTGDVAVSEESIVADALHARSQDDLRQARARIEGVSTDGAQVGKVGEGCEFAAAEGVLADGLNGGWQVDAGEVVCLEDALADLSDLQSIGFGWNRESVNIGSGREGTGRGTRDGKRQVMTLFKKVLFEFRFLVFLYLLCIFYY